MSEIFKAVPNVPRLIDEKDRSIRTFQESPFSFELNPDESIRQELSRKEKEYQDRFKHHDPIAAFQNIDAWYEWYVIYRLLHDKKINAERCIEECMEAHELFFDEERFWSAFDAAQALNHGK